ncbi:fibulin-7-like [Ruditapes philippinarum]|uniref:fibulin-7-like n=1 Tax=Ruditapes philippinarum TaxID=129788 RepID=UPI00295B4DEB|nr:fibulin-7-like [Ruditapes philippinarum]
MDKIHIILCILFHFHGIIYGGIERDLTDCQRGPKYEPCVCNDVPVYPPFGSTEFVDQTQGTYKCEKGYALKVNAIIRCLKGRKNRSNYWNASESACAAIDDCDPSPCYNENICIDGIEDYTCLCLPGYTGKNCSDNITTVSETTSGHVTQQTSNDDSTEKQTISR